MGTQETNPLERQLEEQRRRHERELRRAGEQGVLSGSQASIAVIDGLDRALDELGPAARGYLTGFELLRRSALGELAKLGLTSDYPLTETFDPRKHEAVGQRPGSPEGSVLQVVRRGWASPQGMIRAAQVIVAMPKVAAEDLIPCPHGRPDASQCMTCFRESLGWDEEAGETRRRGRR